MRFVQAALEGNFTLLLMISNPGPVHRAITAICGVLLAVFLAACATMGSPLSSSKEARAVWLSRFDYCGVSPTHDPDSIQAYIAQVVRQAARANFNLLFFQVRGSGDAYYQPGLEPWGSLLTGTLGADPGWDPLQFAIEAAQAHGLELHAWVNVYPAWKGTKPPGEANPPAPLTVHPQWVVADSTGQPLALSDGYTSFSPGIPQVQEHILAVVEDIAARYEVDGIHLDYIRYPDWALSKGLSRDSLSLARFHSAAGNPYSLDWDDWQREQVTQLVARLYNRVTAIDSSIKLSAAVIGSYATTGWNAYNQVYQDPRRWSELGKIDFITPMIYWPRNHRTQPFLVRSREWRERYSIERPVFPGIGSYRYNEEDGDRTWNEALGQIDDLRRARFPGLAFFDARSLENHWAQLATRRFRSPANIPAMAWKDALVPDPPSSLLLTSMGRIGALTWVAPTTEDVVRYNVYFSENIPIDRSRGENLVHVTAGPRLEWVFDPHKLPPNGYLAVSALDAAWNESTLSTPIRWQRK